MDIKSGEMLSIGEKLNRMAGVIEKRDHVGKAPNKMDKDAFMGMLMEQIKYQDPFNPVGNEQFSQQLAVMSQLEQQVETNKNLEKLVMAQSNTQVAALQIVGKDIVADKAVIFNDGEKSTDIKFNLPQNASEVVVNIRDQSGDVIKSLPVGPQSMGAVETKWDGFTDQELPVPVGRYAYTVEAKAMDGKTIEVPTKISGRVTGVTSTGGQTVLMVGEQQVRLDDIETISEAKVTQDNVKTQIAQNSVGAQGVVASKAKDASDTSEESVKKDSEVPALESIEKSETAKKMSSILPLLYR